MARSLVAACALGLLHVGRAVTPVEKVIELLEKLEAQTEEEGKQEAAAYDKYACFCKEQVDEKQYQIEKSIAKIEVLSAEIDKLTSEISTLDGEIAELSTKITGLETESADAQKIRDAEHAVYLEKEADAAGAIDACERAIAALKESKDAMGGKAELEALVQVQAVARTALALSTQMSLSDGQVRTLSAIAGSQPGKAYESTYHSNDIIATIEDLLKRFEGIKAQLDQEEFDTNAMHDKKQLGLKNEIKFAEKEKAEKEALAAEKTDTKEAKQADKDAETKDKNSDKAFQSVLVDECQKKAELWDQRSSTRAAELTAISEAMEALKTGVSPNYKANKKLVGLQEAKAAATGHWVYVEDRPASFLQLRGGSRSRAAERHAADQAGDVLRQVGQKLRSDALIAMSLKVEVAEDHFVKVRALIKDLIERLNEQAKEEATQKSFCDKEMKAATDKRDKEQSNVEDNKAQISSKEAEIAKLTQEIAELSRAIADNKKALKEATDLRQKESAENEKTVAEAEAGKEAVERALEVLKNFYEGAALLQRRAGYVPPNSDREGKTVSDRAPEVFDSEYKGSQDASKGILGMLEVILTDFSRTITTVTAEEEEAEAEFQTFKTENELDTQSKEESKKTKEGLVADAEDALVTLQGAFKEASESLADAQKELEKLHPMCIQGEETYEERVAKREQEIEALKEAHDILENWNA